MFSYPNLEGVTPSPLSTNCGSNNSSWHPSQYHLTKSSTPVLSVVSSCPQGTYQHQYSLKSLVISLTIQSSTPEDHFTALVARGGKLDESEIEAVYNQLPALPIDFLRGEWKGGSFDTGHPGHTQLLTMNWAGKTFHSTESVDPIVLLKDGKRVCDEEWGHAVVSKPNLFRGANQVLT